jgi:hypothetical protein
MTVIKKAGYPAFFDDLITAYFFQLAKLSML